jgi:hypothetical protein
MCGQRICSDEIIFTAKRKFMKMKSLLLFALCFALWSLYSGTAFGIDKTFYSIKIIKASPQITGNELILNILDNPEAWEIMNQNAKWQGENLWEIYFNIATKQVISDMPNIRIPIQGIKPARVIVGNTDVKFEYVDGTIEFQLVNDKSVGQLIETYWRDQRNGLPIYLRHNWRMRAVGPWEPWPENAIQAVDNFLFAAREALRLMELMDPSKDRFEGNIVLMGFETSSSRGHVDHPAHVHIMLYVPGYSPGSCVPHLYVNEEGRIYSNSYVKIGVEGSGRKFGSGEICSMDDLNGRVGLEIEITGDGGLMLRPNDSSEPFYLRPDDEGGHKGVSVSHKNKDICQVSTLDDVSSGEMKVYIEYPDETYTESIHYDPYTGKPRGK